MEDMKAYYNKIVALKNRGEEHWCEFSPLPLYSSSMTGPLECGKDVTEGGAKYNSTAPSLTGAATLIDSLYSVKVLVYDEKKLTLAQLVQILQENYAGNEYLRQYIIHRIPKHGTNDPVLDAFSAKVLEDLSHISGQTNARGGKYLPAFYPHDVYRPLGLKTGATPDARLANTPLSRGISTNEFVETDTPLDVIHSLKRLDLTKFADSFIVDINLPSLEKNEQNAQILVSIIRAFLDAKGSALQFNLIDHEQLLEAKAHPEQYPNLMVRVCGYSAAFVALNEESQNEIIQRAVRS
jgi:formate C-acetyltransferase